MSGPAYDSRVGPQPDDDRLTEALIAGAMARAERIACGGNPGCFALPDPIEEVRKTLDRKGRCVAGWILADSGRTAWDVLLDTTTGEARLRKREDQR